MAKKKTTKKTTKAAWKDESFINFEERFLQIKEDLRTDPLNEAYVNDGKLFFIPISSILSRLLGSWTSHWRRDVLKSVDGVKKLKLLENFLANQELKLDNELLRRRNGYAYIKLIDTYFASRNIKEDMSLDENESIKESIHIDITPTGAFKNGDKD